MPKISVITDFDSTGSGYRYIMEPLLTGLAKLGYEIKVAALNYNGTEHDLPYSLLPSKDIQDCVAIVNNLHFMWQHDLVIVAMDIPLQLQIFETLKPLGKPYIAITPLENPPLTMSWAGGLMQIPFVFFISELGKQAALQAGLSNVDHLFVGVDTESWRPALPQEKSEIRKNIGIGEDEFVILSVAENQERKNLSAAMEIVAGVKREIGEGKVRFVLVTREHNPFGWKLRDLALTLGINRELSIYERGMSRQVLWTLYAAADVYLNTSKGEGLGLPVLDAMAAGIPVVATDTGAITELLEDGRGFLIPAKFTFTDVWGNSKRDMIDVYAAKTVISACAENAEHLCDKDAIERALAYIRSRTWDIPVNQVHSAIEKVLNAQSNA